MTKPNQFWKPKIVVQSQNNQNESRFYKRSASKGQNWVIQKEVTTVNDEKVKTKDEKVFVQNDKDFPSLNEYCVEMPKVQQTWAKLFK